MENMSSMEERVVLIKNLLNRMEFNNIQGNWTLKGAITKDERFALLAAHENYLNLVKKNREKLK